MDAHSAAATVITRIQTMNIRDFVSYRLASALKRAGFDWDCFAYYAAEPYGGPCLHVSGVSPYVRTADLCVEDVLAPCLWQAQKWLREEKGCEVVVEPRYSNGKHIGYDWYVYDDCSGDYAMRAPLPFHDTYESALSAGIEMVLGLMEEGGRERQVHINF